MNKSVALLFIFSFLFNSLPVVASPIVFKCDSTQKIDYNILMVLSSYGKDSGKSRPGYEFDEFSQAYLLFKSNNLHVDIASPKGGPVEPDEFNKDKPYNKAVLADSDAMNKLKHTIPTSTIDASDYHAIFIVGGKGAMFDLPHDPALQDLIAALYQTERVVSAVCHGPAALVHVTLDDGQYLIDDKAVSGFTNKEETLFGNRWKQEFPFLLEDKLIERGVFFEQSDMMLPQVSTAGKLITGQNPYSTLGVAEAVIRVLGKQPVERIPYADEQSVALLKKVVTGNENWAAITLSNDTSEYDLELIAVYGYYRLISAKEEKEVRLAINIIELATPYIYNATLQLTHAEGYLRLGEKATAKQLLMDLVEKEPEFEDAKTLLKGL